MTTQIDTNGLARDGFVIIRNLLEGRTLDRRGSLLARIIGIDRVGVDQALELAEALHNLPDPDNDFTQAMTIERVRAYVDRYPEHRSLLRHLGPDGQDLR